MLVISELGPQLLSRSLDPVALRERVVGRHPPAPLGRDRASRATTASGSPRRSPTTSSATGRSSGCSPTTRSPRSWSTARARSGSSARAGSTRRPCASTTSRTCAASSTRWSPRSAGASTSPRRWSTRAFPTAAASTRSSRRSRSPARSLTIRKFAQQAPRPRGPGQPRDALRASRSTSCGAASRRELNILISGGTGSGKTTLLNALSSAIPDNERIVTIEDAAELQLHQRHVLRLEARPPNIEGEGEITIRDLVRNALRMRPDRIIVGEVPRRRGARHAPGDEHRPRRLAVDGPRQLAARRARAASRRWC